MLDRIPLSTFTASLGLAAALWLTGSNPSSGQPSRQLPSSFDVFFVREGRVAPLFTRPDIRGWLPPLPAAADESERGEAAAAEPEPGPAPEETIARLVEQVLATPAKASTAEEAPVAEGGSTSDTSGAGTGTPTSTGAVASPGKDRDLEPAGRFVAQGKAVWYQHPGRTASGETYNPDGLTAAHRTLPLGTRLRVVNRQNGRSVEVRVNDRMPAKLKYTIDLSRGSARALGIEGVGSVALYQLD